MDGFEKIELRVPKESLPKKGKETVVTRRKSRRKIPKQILIGLSVLLILLVLSIFTVVLPAYRTYKSGIVTYQQARLMATAVKQQNINLASEELTKTKTSLAKTRKEFDSMKVLKFVPIANWYYNDADHALKAATYGLDSAEIVVESLKPYADVLGLQGQGSFVGGTAEERIKTAVLTMGKITPRIDTIADSLVKVQAEVDAIDADHYPSIIFGTKVKEQLLQAQELTDQGVQFVDQARPLIKVLPSLLGEDRERRYLILFQNDKELRPTGGFITAYSVFSIDKGVMKKVLSDDIYKLDDSISGKQRAPEPILKYLPKVSVLNLRDSNLSPDYVVSMKEFEKLYNRASVGTDVDGIVAIDTHVLVSIIKILDDQVTAAGITFTTQNDERCDCPQVIYELEDNISRPVNFVKEDRKGLIGSLIDAIMTKALSSSPKQYWGPLFQSLLMQANQKHILVYLYDEEAQKGIESLNMAGRIKDDFDGDYFHLNQANLGGQKSNLFVDETVEIKYDVKNDGTITKMVTVDYTNDWPPSDCNLERGGLCLNAILRNWFRIYVPKGSKLLESKGSEVKMTTTEDLGKTVFEGFLTVRPGGGKSKLTVTYQLPFKVEKGSPLPVLVQKQPGTFGHPYSIFVNGRKVDEFQLFADKELNLKI